jgi:hypothetical protein
MARRKRCACSAFHLAGIVQEARKNLAGRKITQEQDLEIWGSESPGKGGLTVGVTDCLMQNYGEVYNMSLLLNEMGFTYDYVPTWTSFHV